MVISKSMFKLFLDCPTKLKYRSQKYRSSSEEDEFLSFFADCGYMVEAIARALFPEGFVPEAIGGESDAEATRRAIEVDECVLFEASFVDGDFSARVDILEKRDGQVNLIEIKSKSYSPEEDKNLLTSKGVAAKWRDYVYDIAFQVMVVEAATGLPVKPTLCLVDKSRVSGDEGTFRQVRLVSENEQLSWSAPRAEFLGDPEKLRGDHCLRFLDVSEAVAAVKADVVLRATEAVICLNENRFPAPPLGSHCKSCEYRLSDGSDDGFSQCWGGPGPTNGHVTDLYHASQLGGKGVFGKLVERGARSIGDIPSSSVGSSSVGIRQAMQIKAFTSGQEVMDPMAMASLESLEFPLFFLDFETSRIPVPFHAGMTPFEQIPFQFSCHVVESLDAVELRHIEWINTDDDYPSGRFAASLRECLGDVGSVIVWSPHEQSALKDIARLNQRYRFMDDALANWVEQVHASRSDGGRFVDLMQICLNGYCHPAMAGSVSIKKVLPAIWSQSSVIRSHPWFSRYVAFDEQGVLIEPYDTLPSVEEVVARRGLADPERVLEPMREVLTSLRVDDGVAAMRAYQLMLYGRELLAPGMAELIRDLLSEYCALDTLAMVAIWKYWVEELIPNA
jgi:CRISPR/Cas system-associated exonuclease Cas4 (RecB family)